MPSYIKILSEINAIKKQIDVDAISYSNFYQEKPIADIITFNWKTLLDKPPTNTSSSTYKDLSKISKISKNRSKKDIEFIYSIDKEPNIYLYNFLEKKDIKFPFQEFTDLYNIIQPILLNIKFLYNRPRPYQLGQIYNIDIDVLETQTHHTPSYPSGHVVYTSLATNFIQAKYPKLKVQLQKIIQLTGLARMMQGVHYESDVVAGNQLANILYNKLSGVI